MVSTGGDNEKVWNDCFKLKVNISTKINPSSYLSIKNDLLKHSKKIIVIAQINKYFDGYRSKILKTLPDLIKKQDHKLVDQLHQDTKFTSQLGVFDTIIVNHYYKDQLIATYPWVLTYLMKIILQSPTRF